MILRTAYDPAIEQATTQTSCETRAWSGSRLPCSPPWPSHATSQIWSVGGLDQERGAGVDVGSCGEGRELGTVQACEFQCGLAGEMS